MALARLILDDDVSVQAPPNLNPTTTALLIDAGINDFGGISPVSPDYINPNHPWPHLQGLAARVGERGFELRPRPPIYDRYLDQPAFLHDGLRQQTLDMRQRLETIADVSLLPSVHLRPDAQPASAQAVHP